MSKIEEALKKARQAAPAGAEAVQGGGDAAGKSLQVVPEADADVGSALAVKSNANIACMSEPVLLSHEELARRKIIYPEMEDRRVVQAFRQIRTKLLQRCSGENVVLMVSSVASGYGSSFVALNLAAAFAFDESKTALLVDCNLGDPSLQNILPVDEKNGLTDYLENEDVYVEDIIHATGIPRLRVVPAGRRKEIATEHFTSMRMRSLIAELKQRYPDRHIIMDAPAIMESADARILAEVCDLVLLVIPYGKVSESLVNSTVREIGERKLLGMVFNNEPHVARSVLKKLFRVFGIGREKESDKK